MHKGRETNIHTYIHIYVNVCIYQILYYIYTTADIVSSCLLCRFCLLFTFISFRFVLLFCNVAKTTRIIPKLAAWTMSIPRNKANINRFIEANLKSIYSKL